MDIDFPHFYTAVDWTLEYYGIYRIESEFELLSGKGYGSANFQTVQDTYDLIFKLHDRMEQEIIKTIETCYPARQITHLNIFKAWLGDFRLSKINRVQVAYVINEYNKNIYDKFLIEVDKKEKEFKSTDHYHLDHDAEYQGAELVFMDGASGLLGWKKPTNKMVTMKNKKFFCLENSPEYIDFQYFDQYIARLDKMVSNFSGILKKYVDMYDSNKLPVYQNVVIYQPKEESPATKEVPQPLIHPQKKLQTSLSVPQIGYLFKKLHNAGIIQAGTFNEIQKFISSNFLVSTKGEEGISSGKLAKIWNDFDVKTVNFWVDKFIELHKLSKKDNPNNIK